MWMVTGRRPRQSYVGVDKLLIAGWQSANRLAPRALEPASL